jgi:hypothetical protein
MCQKKPFYITTPIYYPSGNPHIGHCYTTVACDSIARYRRMQGYDVMFLTGTDEHGLKIEQKAAEKGVTPKEYVDEIVKTFKGLWKFMNISYDRYIRTTDDYHIETVKKIFKELYDKGYIYKGLKPVYWCPHDETALAEAVAARTWDAVERARAEHIRSVGERLAMPVEVVAAAVRSGETAEAFNVRALDFAASPEATATRARGAKIGLTEKEEKAYSFVRLISHLADPADTAKRNAAGFEIYCQAADDKRFVRRDFMGFFITLYNSLDPRHKLFAAEGLYNIIVNAQFETEKFVVFLTARRKH